LGPKQSSTRQRRKLCGQRPKLLCKKKVKWGPHKKHPLAGLPTQQPDYSTEVSGSNENKPRWVLEANEKGRRGNTGEMLKTKRNSWEKGCPPKLEKELKGELRVGTTQHRHSIQSNPGKHKPAKGMKERVCWGRGDAGKTSGMLLIKTLYQEREGTRGGKEAIQRERRKKSVRGTKKMGKKYESRGFARGGLNVCRDQDIDEQTKEVSGDDIVGKHGKARWKYEHQT